MIISYGFLENLVRAKIMKTIKVPIGHYYYEYVIDNYKDGTVFGTIELENPIVSDLDKKTLGYFGVNFEHNILAYYLKPINRGD